MSENLRAVDLFSGAGGLSLGFKNADIDILVANDFNKSACKTYRYNFPETPCLKKNIRDVDAKDLIQKGDFDKEDVDLIIGGPPCKGFSMGGKRDPNDPRNSLFKEYLKIVDDLEPSVIVMENVKGLLTLDSGSYRDKILEELEVRGYNVDGMPKVLNAAEYGVPQARERVIFVGVREDSQIDPDDLEFPEAEERISVKEAIDDLSFLGVGESASEYEKPAETIYQERMRSNSEELHNHKSPNHSERIQNRFELMDYGKGMETVPEKYRTKKHTVHKFDPEKPSRTVTTLPEDFVHYSRNRIPTVREMARLQSFPDDFVFKGPRTTGGSRRSHEVPQYSQVGNAVPPLMAESIAKGVKRAFREKILTKQV